MELVGSCSQLRTFEPSYLHRRLTTSLIALHERGKQSTERLCYRVSVDLLTLSGTVIHLFIGGDNQKLAAED